MYGLSRKELLGFIVIILTFKCFQGWILSSWYKFTKRAQCKASQFCLHALFLPMFKSISFTLSPSLLCFMKHFKPDVYLRKTLLSRFLNSTTQLSGMAFTSYASSPVFSASSPVCMDEHFPSILTFSLFQKALMPCFPHGLLK